MGVGWLLEEQRTGLLVGTLTQTGRPEPEAGPGQALLGQGQGWAWGVQGR